MNSRLDTLQAAIILAKLEVFDDELAARDRVAAEYEARLGEKVSVPVRPNGRQSAWAQFAILLDERDSVAAYLKEAGIPTAIYYPQPMHLQTAYRGFGNGEGSLPVSEELCERILNLPIHPYLETADVDRISEAVLQSVGAD